MSWHNKVVWSEGMFLRPQIFQQADRYVEALVRGRIEALRPYDWGYSRLAVDDSLLKMGKISVTGAQGVMPDGTPFRIPEDCDPPPPLDVPEGTRACQVYLALPAERVGGIEVDLGQSSELAARAASGRAEVADINTGARTTTELDISRLRFQLMLETEERGGYVSLGICEIVERSPDKAITLESRFIPPVLDCLAAPALAAHVKELLGMLHQRGDAIATRIVNAGQGGASDLADFLVLQVVNRFEPLFLHLSRMRDLHPEALYQTCLQLMGELATFTSDSKRPDDLQSYNQDALRETFDPLIAALRRALSMVFEQTAIQIPLEDRRYGIRVGVPADRSLFSQASLVLAVRADHPPDFVRTRFPSQAKIGPVEKIRELVNLALPGIELRALPVAPRQIPYHAGLIYFELDRGNELWSQLASSGGIAIHVSGEFPGLDLALWAIRG